MPFNRMSYWSNRVLVDLQVDAIEDEVIKIVGPWTPPPSPPKHMWHINYDELTDELGGEFA